MAPHNDEQDSTWRHPLHVPPSIKSPRRLLQLIPSAGNLYIRALVTATDRIIAPGPICWPFWGGRTLSINTAGGWFPHWEGASCVGPNLEMRHRFKCTREITRRVYRTIDHFIMSEPLESWATAETATGYMYGVYSGGGAETLLSRITSQEVW